MTKGSYPVGWKGKIHGHDVYVEGKGWVYRPLPEPIAWIVLDSATPPRTRLSMEDHDGS